MDKVIVYRDRAGEWRWRRKAANGNIVGDSGEGYPSKAAALEAASREAAPTPAIVVLYDEPEGVVPPADAPALDSTEQYEAEQTLAAEPDVPFEEPDTLDKPDLHSEQEWSELQTSTVPPDDPA